MCSAVVGTACCMQAPESSTMLVWNWALHDVQPCMLLLLLLLLLHKCSCTCWAPWYASQ